MKRFDIINQFISDRDYKIFLEIGTSAGETYKNVTAPIRISVDPDMKSMATYRMTSDQFFDLTNLAGSPENLLLPDVIFIDGLHTHDQAYADIRNAMSILNPNGVIIIHDCLPESEQMQAYKPAYTGGLWTGDVWKAFVKYRSECPYEMYTINTDFGCGVIDTTMKKKTTRSLKLPSDMEAMTYEQFVQNRDKWMNVKEGIQYAE